MDDRLKGSLILIAGLGLIGGSAAKALKAAGFENICAYDSDKDTLRTAASEGVIVEGYTATRSIPECDLIISCLPPGLTLWLCRELQSKLKKGGVFAEMSGVKSGLTEDLCDSLTEGKELLPLHPMAGSEKSGFASSDKHLLRGSMLIMTPVKKTGNASRVWAVKLKEAFGCTKVAELTPKTHDEIIAHVSHMPHIVALALKHAEGARGLAEYAGGSYRDATRVANLNAPLWAELFTLNKKNLLPCIEQFKDSLIGIEEAIRQGDQKALEKLLDGISNG